MHACAHVCFTSVVVLHRRYGVGIAAGISVVGWLKRKIKQLPVVGLLASPFLSEHLGHPDCLLYSWQQQHGSRVRLGIALTVLSSPADNRVAYACPTASHSIPSVCLQQGCTASGFSQGHIVVLLCAAVACQQCSRRIRLWHSITRHLQAAVE